MSTPTVEQARQICEAVFRPMRGEPLHDAARRALDLAAGGARALGPREEQAAIALVGRAYPEDHRVREAAAALIAGGARAR